MGAFTTGDGISIDYSVRGSGPPLLACHGGPANISDTLAEALRPLEDDRTLVYHDYRGSGRSASAPAATYTFERLADDLEELRCHLGYGPAPVLAHSMGGFVALHYALRHPESCSGLVLVGTTPTGDPRKVVGRALRALGPGRTAKLAGRALWYLGAWAWRPESVERRSARYAIMATTQEGVPATRARVREASAGLPAPNDNVPHLERLFSQVDLTAELSRIECPVLVLYGERDAVMVAGGELFRSHLPRARQVVLPKVGHEPFLEAPDGAFPPIREFLRRI
ncbi:MAG TPA: alpha/beta hydrolase [Acidimicrobiales bacterium]|nr:alpha/beta hydrolase [Acidimicrobiales bacterium]